MIIHDKQTQTTAFEGTPAQCAYWMVAQGSRQNEYELRQNGQNTDKRLSVEKIALSSLQYIYEHRITTTEEQKRYSY